METSVTLISCHVDFLISFVFVAADVVVYHSVCVGQVTILHEVMLSFFPQAISNGICWKFNPTQYSSN
jgi:hypothetical protein